MTLLEFVDRLVADKYQTAQRLSEAIGMTPSGFSRGVRSGTLTAENLLRLASETGVPASEVLAIGGKADVADMIERLYGKAAAAPPSGDLRTIAELWPALPVALQSALLLVMRHLAKQGAPARRRSA